MHSAHKLNIHLEQLVRALSLALGLAEYSAYTNHGQRVTYIAARLGMRAGFSVPSLEALYFAGLLHDLGLIGAGGVRAMDDERFIQSHAAIGSQLVKPLPFHGIEPLVKYHHEYMDGSGPFGLVGENIPLGARILSLADTIDNAMVIQTDKRMAAVYVSEVVEQGRGRLFDHALCDIWSTLAKQESFWLDLSERNLSLALLRLQPSTCRWLDANELRDVAEVFAEIVDCKSRFTARHSRGLAELVQRVALTDARLAPNADLLYVAALLHDLGKLDTPNTLLEKPGPLTPDERAVVKSHVYYTKLILRQVDGLQVIAEWAGNHHERMDGKGYADRLGASELGLEDRLMAVCDVYQALTEKRPYRDEMSSPHALDVLASMVKSGALDGEAVRLLAEVI